MSDTMVVPGPITLHKVPTIRDGSCVGCFFMDIPCEEVRTMFRTDSDICNLACIRGDYIWEVQPCQSTPV